MARVLIASSLIIILASTWVDYTRRRPGSGRRGMIRSELKEHILNIVKPTDCFLRAATESALAT